MTKIKKITEIKSKIKEISHKSELKLEVKLGEKGSENENNFIMHEIKVEPPIIREISDNLDSQKQNIPQGAPERTASRPAPATYDFNIGRNPYDTRIRQNEIDNFPTTLSANQQGSQNFRPILKGDNLNIDRSVQRQQALGGEADSNKYYESKQKRRYPWETEN